MLHFQNLPRFHINEAQCMHHSAYVVNMWDKMAICKEQNGMTDKGLNSVMQNMFPIKIKTISFTLVANIWLMLK